MNEEISDVAFISLPTEVKDWRVLHTLAVEHGGERDDRRSTVDVRLSSQRLERYLMQPVAVFSHSQVCLSLFFSHQSLETQTQSVC